MNNREQARIYPFTVITDKGYLGFAGGFTDNLDKAMGFMMEFSAKQMAVRVAGAVKDISQEPICPRCDSRNVVEYTSFDGQKLRCKTCTNIFVPA